MTIDPRPVPDALMIRSMRPGVSALCRVPEHRMGAFLEGGWMILISESQIRAEDITDAYHADQMKWRLKERR